MIGEELQTDHFAVTLNTCLVADSVNTGNKFSDLKEEPNAAFLILDTTFKNTDTESRMISAGSIFILINGKPYEFDKTESIMADGYTSVLDQINPFLSKSTKLVYKIPKEIRGQVFWEPGRNSKHHRFYCRDL